MSSHLPPLTPLHPLLDEINAAATHGLPFMAVAMAVALPDICVSLSSIDGRSDASRYKDWCRNHLGSEFAYLTPEDLWSMRCGVLHNGRFGDMKHNVQRVIFALPGNATWTNAILDDVYFYSVDAFCRNLTQAVRQWLERHLSDPTIQANMPRLMQYRPAGLAPYVVGVPVLA